MQFNAGTIEDVVADPAHHRVYFSVANEVVVLSSDTYLIQQQLFVGSLPKGLKLSSDGQKLYVALGQGGSLVVVDLNTFAFTTIEVATQMGTSYLSDVLEVHPGVVLVSGQKLVTVDLNNNGRVTLVAGGVNAGFDARLHASLDGRFVYVGSPSPLYQYLKLDNTTPALPVMVQSGLIGGEPDQFALSTDGDKLMVAGGEIYDTSHFALIGNGYENGTIGETSDDSSVLQAGGTTWTLYDGTFTPSALINTDCAPQFVLNGVASAGFPGQWLINVSDGSLCVFSTTAPNSPPGVDANRTISIFPPQQAVNTLETVVGNFPHDMVADFAHDRFYVTLPQDQKVVIVAAAEGGIVGIITMPGQPGHLVLSADGVHMYVGMLDSGTLAIVDLTTASVTQTLDLSGPLGQAATGALLERSPGDLLVGGPVANGQGQLLSYAVELDPADLTTAHRIGNTQGYCGPNFAMSPDGNFLYIDNAACTVLVEKRDLTVSGSPVVMTSQLNDPLTVFGANFSSDGTRLYLQGGYVVDALTLRVIAYMVGGTQFLSADESRLFSILDIGMETWSSQTQQRLALVSGNCQSYSLDWGSARNLMWPDRQHWAILSVGDAGDPGSVCVMDTVPP